jgi:hypothetical protein
MGQEDEGQRKMRTSINAGLTAIAVLCLCVFRAAAQEQSPENADAGGWRIFSSAYFEVHYREGADLRKIERRLKTRNFYSTAPKQDPMSSIERKIAYRLDLIFERAKGILDMRPENIKVKILIFPTRGDLADEYYRIFRYRRDYKSFFIYKYDTIYTNEEDISDSVIAHEMGHAITDHYFLVMPPAKVKEMLAGYVDVHLDD